MLRQSQSPPKIFILLRLFRTLLLVRFLLNRIAAATAAAVLNAVITTQPEIVEVAAPSEASFHDMYDSIIATRHVIDLVCSLRCSPSPPPSTVEEQIQYAVRQLPASSASCTGSGSTSYSLEIAPAAWWMRPGEWTFSISNSISRSLHKASFTVDSFKSSIHCSAWWSFLVIR